MSTQSPVPGTGTPEHFRRLHPLTPLLRGWGYFAAVVVIIGQNALREPAPIGYYLAGGAAFVVLASLAGAVSWWFTRYGFDGDALRIDSGVLMRRSRRVRMDRLQAVDVNRPLVGRLLGVAELRMEVAGGGKSEAPLKYLSVDDAVRLRAELLARAAGIDAQTPEAPERRIHETPLQMLVWSTILSAGFVSGMLFVLALVVALVLVPSQARFGLMSAMLPGLLATGYALWTQLGQNFGFTLAHSPDGYRIRKGLLDTVHQTVPPGRVQGVLIRQPLLWRIKGWAEVHVDVAGYAGNNSSDSTTTTSTLLPVAPHDEAMAIARQVLEADPADVELRPTPRRARWLRPIQQPRLAYGADDRIVVVRDGRLTRRLTVVPHAKTQSVRVTQGPLQRRLRLASAHVDTTPGPVNAIIRHRPPDEAFRFVEEQTERARLARKQDVREQWMAQHAPRVPLGDTDGDAP
ncbi:PH domain-containing protein [Phytoactinopolyspora halotolerans]|uniref:PH domain-containing protein n=1 Tax=Phytoactinopolyspora halotolerans TaxID=1981512 RepID=A0A6L9S1B5_9ACTN|nr:PH domain-containing protein [Phytoactinopolyspora halotolerans]NED98842.1 PH domain-containing protein [Phytoactinopolyspora halotolerans]